MDEKLESVFTEVVQRNPGEVEFHQAVREVLTSLGSLIAKLKKHDLLSENGVEVLRVLKRQRNYLIHSLFDLFSARIEETVLPRTDLVPMDVTLFTEKAWQLEQNLSGLSLIVEERIAQVGDGISKPTGAVEHLFRP